MPLTTNSFTYSGGAQTFTLSLGLGYEAESDISVYVEGELDGNGDQIYRAFTFNSEFVILVTADLDVDDVVVVERTVSSTVRKVDFETGGTVTPRNLQLQYDHLLSLFQELLDGRVGLLNPTVDAAAASASAAAAAVSAASIDVSKLAGIEALADVTDSVNVGAANWAAAAKATPIDADTIVLADTAASNAIKKTTWTQVKAFLKTYFDTQYNNYSHPNHTGDVTSTGDGATVIGATKVTFAMMAAIADAAAFRANTASKVLDAAAVWAAAAEVTLSDETNIPVDMDTFINAKVTLTDNRTLANPSNEKVGQSGCIRVIQDAGGTNTLAFGTDYEFTDGVTPLISTGGDEENLLFYQVLAADRVFISLASDIS